MSSRSRPRPVRRLSRRGHYPGRVLCRFGIVRTRSSGDAPEVRCWARSLRPTGQADRHFGSDREPSGCGEARMPADGVRFVIRYDHRDTGRSVTYPPERPGYTVADLVADGLHSMSSAGTAPDPARRARRAADRAQQPRGPAVSRLNGDGTSLADSILSPGNWKSPVRSWPSWTPRTTCQTTARGMTKRGWRTWLSPHVMVLFRDGAGAVRGGGLREAAARLAETLSSWGCWDESWGAPASGRITQARQRLGPKPLELLFGKVAEPGGRAIDPRAFLRSPGSARVRRPVSIAERDDGAGRARGAKANADLPGTTWPGRSPAARTAARRSAPGSG
jgi:hypothetical protein